MFVSLVYEQQRAAGEPHWLRVAHADRLARRNVLLDDSSQSSTQSPNPYADGVTTPRFSSQNSEREGRNARVPPEEHEGVEAENVPKPIPAPTGGGKYANRNPISKLHPHQIADLRSTLPLQFNQYLRRRFPFPFQLIGISGFKFWNQQLLRQSRRRFCRRRKLLFSVGSFHYRQLYGFISVSQSNNPIATDSSCSSSSSEYEFVYSSPDYSNSNSTARGSILGTSQSFTNSCNLYEYVYITESS